MLTSSTCTSERASAASGIGPLGAGEARRQGFHMRLHHQDGTRVEVAESPGDVGGGLPRRSSMSSLKARPQQASVTSAAVFPGWRARNSATARSTRERTQAGLASLTSRAVRISRASSGRG